MEEKVRNINDCYTLANGVKIPCVAYGTFFETEVGNSDIFEMAIDTGYRYFDTASAYGTENYLAEAMEKSGIRREEFFLASKLRRDCMGYEETKKEFERSLKRLHTDYLDLYLIHWPLPTPDYKEWKTLDLACWRAMEELYREGRVRAVGVSNFMPYHIENILKNCDVPPMVNQIEFHPGYSQEITLQYCRKHNILVQAWSPIGRRKMLEEPLILKLAEKYKVSAAQISLRYCIQRGVIPLPKSSSYERMKQNQDLFAFEISEEDMYRLETLPQIGWSGQHPERERIYFE